MASPGWRAGLNVAGDWDVLSGLVKSSHEAALATLEAGASGAVGPYASATGYIVEDEARLTVDIFLSRLARHTKNIIKNPSVSLLVMESKPEAPIHEKMRATLMGQAVPVQEKETFTRLKQAYLKKFPRAEVFFTLPDFTFYRIEPVEIHWIAGFGKAGTLFFKEGKWQA